MAEESPKSPTRFGSYYAAGFRIFDVSNPAKPAVVDEFATDPNAAGEGFKSAFGVYPFTSTGHVFVSDWQNGLYIFDVKK